MPSEFSPIAIVGVSAIFPGSTDAHGFWRDILAGKDLITDVPESRWRIEDHYDPDPKADDKTYCKRGSFLGEIDFDPIEFGVQPAAISATDTCQLLALIAARQVLDDAMRNQFKELDRERASVILGVTSGQQLFLNVTCRLQRGVWQKALRESGVEAEQATEICDRITNSYVPWQENTFPGLLGNVVAGRIANRFNLGGTNCVIDAACASSLSALAMAVDELHLGHSDLVITGGADTFNDAPMFVAFSKTPALSRSGDCRPFSDKADGTILGEGVALFALRRLEDAERDGNRIYSVIRGLGSSSDGRSKSIYAPVPEGQAKALRRCYKSAGYGAETVGMVEAHGTGTVAGDAAEFEGLRQVFTEAQHHRADSDVHQWCALGSIKSQIGHTKAAAGAANLFKAVFALHHKILPPTIKVDRPNPKLSIEQSPFYLNTQTRPWLRPADFPRRASISSFGFGGTNFHVALEEYEGSGVKPPKHWNAAGELILLSAATPSALDHKCSELARQAGKENLAELARDSQLLFDATQPHRMAIVCESLADLKKRLEPANRAMPGIYSGSGKNTGHTAFLFPGQGSQYAGMTADVSMAFEEARRAWDRAPNLGEAVFPKPVFTDDARKAQATLLTRTEWAQPAIGAASVALLNILNRLEVVPDCVGGHSFGEITALYASGGADFDTMLNIARKRGELMAEASTTPGGMLSVRHGATQIQEWITEWGVDLAVANMNGPSQTVLSGSIVAIEEAEGLLKQHGNGVMRLPVSTAFHSPLVAPAAGAFREHLEDCVISTSELPFYANFDGALHPVDTSELCDRLADQVSSSVRFHEMVERMYTDGIRTFIEVGPSSVLTGLVKSILGERPFSAISLDRQGTNGVVALWHGLGQLAVLGVPMNWAALRIQHDIQPEPRGQEKKFIVKINGGNYGRPYPAPDAVVTRKPVVAKVVAAKIAAPVAPAPPAPAPLPVVNTLGGSKVLPHTPSNDGTELYRVFQESISGAHQSWQANLAKGHEDYLKAMESAYFAALGTPVAHAAPAAPAVYAPAPAPVPVAVAPRPVVVVPVAPPPTVVIQPVVIEPVAKAAPTQNVRETLWALVADKTGYPAEMLEPGMALEADLGIDSIKRVEIFAAVQEALPGLPELPHADIGRLRTLEDIAVYLQDHLGESKAVAPGAATVSDPSVDIQAVLLAVISEKTGYPSEMLEPGMALEADLGIDSIKRVEIFAAVQDAIPGLPELPHADIGRLRTLDDIAIYLKGHMGESKAAPVAAPAVAVAPSVNIQAILLEVIAEKTGYPVEMLEPGMALEADLGIDSIKRVEIFAAMSERVPGMKEPDMSELGPLKSIADVAGYLQGGAPAPTAPPTPAPAPTAKPAAKSVATGLRHVVTVRPAPATGHSILNENIGSITITDDGLGIADALSELLIVRGYEAAVSYDVPAGIHAVICLAGLREFPSRAAAIAANLSAFDVARAAATTIADGGLFVTVQDTGGRFEPKDELRAWAGGLSALAKTAALEWPQATVKAIDIEIAGRTPLHIAQALLNELLQGGPELEVGLSAKGERTTLETISGPAAGTPLSLGPLGPDSVIIASGGARGVTAQSLLHLAKQTHSRFALLGRTPLTAEPSFCLGLTSEAAMKKAFLADAKSRGETLSPANVSVKVSQVVASREVNEVLLAFKAAGSEARYIALDIRDRESLSKSIGEIRSAWGPITGLVHGAGVLADKLIAELTPERFDLVFSTKVEGLEGLLDATAADPLRFIALFSSVAARNGNPGQAAYAMANEVMNRVAHAEAAKRGHTRVKSLNWGPWDGGMVTPALRAHFAKNGVSMLGVEEGANLFAEEILRGSDAEIEIVLGHPLAAA